MSISILPYCSHVSVCCACHKPMTTILVFLLLLLDKSCVLVCLGWTSRPALIIYMHLSGLHQPPLWSWLMRCDLSGNCSLKNALGQAGLFMDASQPLKLWISTALHHPLPLFTLLFLFHIGWISRLNSQKKGTCRQSYITNKIKK